MPARAIGSTVCVGLLSLFALALFAAPAGAASYCVAPATGCDIAKADFGEALAAAAATPAEDSIRLGAATYAQNGLEYVAASVLTIEGAGASATTIERSGGAGAVLKLGGPGRVEVSKLRIRPGAEDEGLVTSGGAGGVIDAVAVESGAATDKEGVLLSGGWTMRNSTVDLPSPSPTCVYLGPGAGGPARIEDSTLRGCQFGLSAQDGPFVAQRLRIHPSETGITVGAGAGGRLEDSLIIGAELGVQVSPTVAPTSAVVKQSTLIGTGAGSEGVKCDNESVGPLAGNSLTLEDSIIRGFATALVARGAAGRTCPISADFNDYDPTAVEETGATISAANGPTSTRSSSTPRPAITVSNPARR